MKRSGVMNNEIYLKRDVGKYNTTERNPCDWCSRCSIVRRDEEPFFCHNCPIEKEGYRRRLNEVWTHNEAVAFWSNRDFKVIIDRSYDE